MTPQMPAFLSSIPIDWIVIGAAFILIAAFILRFGTDIPAALTLALPSASMLDALLPHAAFIGTALKSFSTPMEQAGIFVVLVVILTFLFARVISTFGAGANSFMAAGCASLATIIMLLIFWTQLLALAAVWHFGSPIQSFFVEQYRFWWIAGSFILLAVARL